jgi:hypothetical protein
MDVENDQNSRRNLLAELRKRQWLPSGSSHRRTGRERCYLSRLAALPRYSRVVTRGRSERNRWRTRAQVTRPTRVGAHRSTAGERSAALNYDPAAGWHACACASLNPDVVRAFRSENRVHAWMRTYDLFTSYARVIHSYGAASASYMHPRGPSGHLDANEESHPSESGIVVLFSHEPILARDSPTISAPISINWGIDAISCGGASLTSTIWHGNSNQLPPPLLHENSGHPPSSSRRWYIDHTQPLTNMCCLSSLSHLRSGPP